MPRLPMTIIGGCVVKGHTGENQDQLLYLDIVRERQQRASELVQESYLIAMSKIQLSNTKLLTILHKLPNFEVGNWVWIYNPQAAVGQGASEDNSHLVTKLSLNWTGPYKILVVGPGLRPDGRPVADKTGVLHYRALHGNLHGAPWRPPRSSMKASTEPHGPPWTSMEASTDLHGTPWRPPRTSTGLHGDLHGAPRTSIETSTDLHRPSWRPPRTSTDLHP